MGTHQNPEPRGGGEAERPPAHSPMCTHVLRHLGTSLSSYPEKWRPREFSKWLSELGLEPASTFKALVLGPWAPPLLCFFSASESAHPSGCLSEGFQTSPHPTVHDTFSPQHRPGHTEGASQPPAASVKRSPTPPSGRSHPLLLGPSWGKGAVSIITPQPAQSQVKGAAGPCGERWEDGHFVAVLRLRPRLLSPPPPSPVFL